HWGTLIKIQEYLVIYGLDWMTPASKGLAIWMSSAELMMGCMLTFKVRIRMVSIFALTAMSIFTVVSLLSATLLPVEDCGCFGEAIRLTPWQTFFKNMCLWPMAFVIWYRYRPDKIFVFKILEISLAATFFFSTVGLSYYCYNHLPLIDFRPYKIGVNLPEAIETAASARAQFETVLVCRNLKSGKIKEFALEDKQWQDDSRWEWMETRIISDEEPSVRASVSEFSLRNAYGKECTNEIISYDEGAIDLICVTKMRDIDPECMERLKSFIEQSLASGNRVVCLTPERLYDEDMLVAGHRVEAYNIDPSTMKTVIRAEVGVVTLKNGVIINKRNWRDL
ncbi:MAG: BT_3928 family protein, partial [Rikenellaceae bacterium]